MPPKKTETKTEGGATKKSTPSYQVRSRPNRCFLEAVFYTNITQAMITDAIVNVLNPIPLVPAHRRC